METQTDPSMDDLAPRPTMVKYKYVTVYAPPEVTYLPSDWTSVTAFLAEQAHVSQGVDDFRKEMLHQLQARLVQPRTQDLWQAPYFCMSNVPRAAAVAMMKEMQCSLDTASKRKWKCCAPELMHQCCRGLGRVHAQCMGQSKALGKGKRHPWHRAVATVIQFEATHCVRKGGRQLFYVNALYVLMLESGEIVKPRTAEKTPIFMTDEEEGRARKVIMRDLKLMALKGFSLSGKLLQMLGASFTDQATMTLASEERILTEAADQAEGAVEDWRRDAVEAGEVWDDDEAAPNHLPSPPRFSGSDTEVEVEEVTAPVFVD